MPNHDVIDVVTFGEAHHLLRWMTHHNVSRQHGLTARPCGEAAKSQQHQQQKFGLELRGSAAVVLDEPWRNERQDYAREGGPAKIGACFPSKGTENKSECENGEQVIDEASRQYGLARSS